MSKKDKDRALLSAFRRAAKAVMAMTEEDADKLFAAALWQSYYASRMRRQAMNNRALALALLTAWGL